MWMRVAVGVVNVEGAAQNLSTESKDLSERRGTGCKRQRDAKDNIQMFGLSSQRGYYQGEGEACASSKFRKKMSSLVWVLSSPL